MGSRLLGHLPEQWRGLQRVEDDMSETMSARDKRHHIQATGYIQAVKCIQATIELGWRNGLVRQGDRVAYWRQLNNAGRAYGPSAGLLASVLS